MRELWVAALAATMAVGVTACDNSSATDAPGEERTFTEAQVIAKDPTRTGPAPDIEGAQDGGTITVYLPGDPGPNSLDPTGGWYVPGNALQQGLVSRSLTQYARDPETGAMVLVPDLATDLGQPNEDLTEWTFTLRDGITWENGQPITAEEVAFGITRSMDSQTFPGGAGTQYSQTYFLGAGDYEGPYTDPDTDWDGVEFDNEAKTVTIKMAKPFGDMDYWGAFMTMGPVPLGKVSDPPDYGLHPLANGPYKVESFRPQDKLVLVRNDEWDPASDPARHQYVDRWVFKFNANQDQVDQLLLSGNEESRTAMTFTIGVNDYRRLSDRLGDHLVQDPTTCTQYLAPDYEKLPDLAVRRAIAYAHPYEDVWLASGKVPGVTDVPAGPILPPGMAGRHDYQPDGRQFTYDPDRARALLEDAGYEPGEVELSYIYYEPDPLAIDAAKQARRGYETAGFKVTMIPVDVSPYDIWTDPDNKINKRLTLRSIGWCSDWPSGLTMIPPLVESSAVYNLSRFDEPEVDDEIERIGTLPLEEQADAWGVLDERLGTEFLPLIPTSYINNLYAFGSAIGNPAGDSSLGAPDFKDLYVEQ